MVQQSSCYTKANTEAYWGVVSSRASFEAPSSGTVFCSLWLNNPIIVQYLTPICLYGTAKQLLHQSKLFLYNMLKTKILKSKLEKQCWAWLEKDQRQAKGQENAEGTKKNKA